MAYVTKATSCISLWALTHRANNLRLGPCKLIDAAKRTQMSGRKYCRVTIGHRRSIDGRGFSIYVCVCVLIGFVHKTREEARRVVDFPSFHVKLQMSTLLLSCILVS
jgi:hypothetical protein